MVNQIWNHLIQNKPRTTPIDLLPGGVHYDLWESWLPHTFFYISPFAQNNINILSGAVSNVCFANDRFWI